MRCSSVLILKDSMVYLFAMNRRLLSRLVTHLTFAAIALGITGGNPARADLIHVERPLTIFGAESARVGAAPNHATKLIGESAVQELDLLKAENLSFPLPADRAYSLDDACSDSRFGGPAQYLDTLSSAVFQYYDQTSNISFPFTASQIDFGLYFLNSGQATDSFRLVIGINCPSFGQICCTPRFQDCYGVINVHRGSPFPTLLQLSIVVSVMASGSVWLLKRSIQEGLRVFCFLTDRTIRIRCQPVSNG
jgi:hypothetical protein